MSELRRGWIFGLAAYGLWGCLPIYWKLLAAFDPLTILSFRIVHASIFMVMLVAATGRWPALRATLRSRRAMLLVGVCALLITFNWFTYIWGVNEGFIVECSLGYYINPLVSVLLGVFVLKERFTILLAVCTALALAGVLVLTMGHGLPWISLALAGSFAIYGLLKKTSGVDALVGVALETLVVVPLALGLLGWLGQSGQIAHTPPSTLAWGLSLLAGAITAVPLVLFAAASQRMPLSVLGFIQYVAPTLQLLIGTLVYGEAFTARHAVAFSLIWAAVLLFSGSQLRRARSTESGTLAPGGS